MHVCVLVRVQGIEGVQNTLICCAEVYKFFLVVVHFLI